MIPSNSQDFLKFRSGDFTIHMFFFPPSFHLSEQNFVKHPRLVRHRPLQIAILMVSRGESQG